MLNNRGKIEAISRVRVALLKIKSTTYKLFFAIFLTTVLQGVPKKSVNKEISITFEQTATQRFVRSQIGGIFGS